MNAEPISTDTSTLRTEDARRLAILALNERLRACRRCHAAGYLDERESIPLARDPDPDAPLPRILLVGQAPGLRATRGHAIERSLSLPRLTPGLVLLALAKIDEVGTTASKPWLREWARGLPDPAA